jgi:cell wall-associated NlpC family hydrolase
VSYKFGGNTPDVGLDCSGFVRLVVKDVLGKVLPRRSEEISNSSQAIKAEDLKPGDLVFFNTLKRTFSHVGIYVGNNQFIHSPSAGNSVRIETLDKQYWSSRFDGARRLVGLPDRIGSELFRDASAKELPSRNATDRVGQ